MPYVLSERQKERVRACSKKWRRDNPEKVKRQKKLYDIRHPEKVSARHREWLANNRDKNLRYAREYKKRNPWYVSFNCAKQRCLNPNNSNYHRYGGRGIKFLLSKSDIIFLWIRDKAFSMNRPSIDRINNDGNYVMENCRIVEFLENSKKGTKALTGTGLTLILNR